jgi:hypothetical protein
MHSLTEHLQTHATDNPKKCQYCGLMFESRNRLKIHWAETAGDGIHNINMLCQRMHIFVLSATLITGKRFVISMYNLVGL